jgi:hypothetical protein
MFMPAGETRTYGEIDPAAKHATSHRARAFAQLVAALAPPCRLKPESTMGKSLLSDTPSSRIGSLCQEQTSNADLALYIHWPFCVSKCPYCDFNSHVRAAVDQETWREALLADLAWEAALLPGRRLTSIFFGGGTPSLMPPATVAALIDAALNHWPGRPRSGDHAGGQPFLRGGRALRRPCRRRRQPRQPRPAIARRRRAALSSAALMASPKARCPRHRAGKLRPREFDLIYALPGQDVAAWKPRSRTRWLLGTGHLSLSQLTIEPGTRFAAMARAAELAHPDPIWRDLYGLTEDMTDAAGLPAYEISNHAARRGEPPQPRLLALPRLCRGRPRRARPPPPLANAAPPQARKLARGRRGARPRHRRTGNARTPPNAPPKLC